jgi:hypothetical protein
MGSSRNIFGRFDCFISHLGRQQTIIADMGSTAPRLVNRWLSADKGTSWFKKHRPALLCHIETKQPRSSPPLLWWVSLLAMDFFTSLSSKTFRKIQGLSTLVAQQQVELDELVASFAAEVKVEGIRLYEGASFSPDRLHSRPEAARYLLTLVTACSDRDTHTLSKFS